MRRLAFIVLIALAFTTAVTGGLATSRRIAAPAITSGSAEDPSATSLTNFTAYWRLDETSGTRNDVSANAQHLTDNNTVTSAAGIKTNAASFASASSEYLSRADEAALSINGSSFSFSLWVKATTFPLNAFFLNKSDGGSSSGEYYLLYLTSNQKFQFSIQNGATTTPVYSTTTVTTGTWYHIIVMWDSSNSTSTIILNNGTASTAVTAVSPPDSTQAFQMGAKTAPTARYWDGLIDEVGFWKRTLTAAEITYLYNSGSGRTYNSSTGRFE